MADTPSGKSTMLHDILSIAGFTILFIILLWGLFHLVGLMSSWFSSLLPRQAPAITLTVPAEVVAGEPVQLAWRYATDKRGSYAFLYQCADGVAFALPGATSSYMALPCGSAWGLGSATSSISMVPLLPATSTKAVTNTISVIFIPSEGGTQAHGDAKITIKPGSVHAAKPTEKPTAQTATQKTHTPSGTHTGTPADIAVRIVAIGVIDPATGAFMNRSVASADDIAAVQFDIGNEGGTTSSSYTFAANLPTVQAYPYQSDTQAPLGPGDHVLNTLRFTQVAPGGGVFSVTVMPNGRDAVSSDDSASITVSAPYYPVGPTILYGNPGPYYQPAYTY